MMNYLMTYQTGASELAQYSSNSIRKGDMIRLREILLNYELPKNGCTTVRLNACL